MTERKSLLDEMGDNPIEAREMAAADLFLDTIVVLNKAFDLSKMTLEELSISLGISRERIHETLSGDRPLPFHYVARFLHACGYKLKLSLENILTEETIIFDPPVPRRRTKIPTQANVPSLTQVAQEGEAK